MRGDIPRATAPVAGTAFLTGPYLDAGKKGPGDARALLARDHREDVAESIAEMTLARSGGESGSETRVPNRAAMGLVFRSIKLPAAFLALILILALTAFGITAWRALRHLEPVESHLAAITRLQQAGLNVEELTIGHFEDGAIPGERVAQLRDELTTLIARDGLLSPNSRKHLTDARTALADLGGQPGKTLLAVRLQIRKALADEIQAHRTQLSKLKGDLLLEFSITGVALVVLTGLGILLVVRMRRRVLDPLNTLERFLVLLANRDYSLAPVEGVDPIIQPLTESYNHLVNRLKALEEEGAWYRDTLEQRVRTATEALLVQNRNLASAERLATAGEVAARIAHELRNPLAGMQMALSNIRAEIEDRKDVVGRMDLVIDELRRVTGLLNGLLDQSRITPEPFVDTAIGRTIDELLTIVRYQIPKEIELRSENAGEISCRVPRDSLRQALLNLILNAADAIGAGPGRIVVSAGAHDELLELSVSDDGPGFPADLLREGIGPFRTGRSGGTGLGLSIVSRLVRNLDGRMELSNLEPHGARVRLILPFRGANV